MATEAGALGCVTDGAGDQVLIAEGTSYVAGLSGMQGRGGYSAAYPTVIQSYDPADPTNEAKFGRATGTARPVVNTGGATNQIFVNTIGISPKFIAVRGLDFNPGNVPGASISIVAGASTGTPDYILFENDIFRYTTLGADMHMSTSGRQTKLIVRNSSFYGEWDPSTATVGQGLYISYADGYTVEDSVFYHVGWKLGANRTDDMSVGGLNVFRHPIYGQEDTGSGTVRRNLFLDNYDGGSLRGAAVSYTQNLNLNNSIGFALGRGDHYATAVPNGAVQEAAYNAIMGSGAILGGSSDRGVWMFNGKSGQSSVHHNVFARSVSKGNWTFVPDTFGDSTHPTYVDFHDNVAWNWSMPGSSTDNESYGPFVFATYENNIWDDAASGSNTNIATHTFANPYTQSGLWAALGYADYASFINDVINNPEKHVQRHGLNLMLAGYGVDTSAMAYLPNS